jgi:N-acetylmuramoyl-L-alanine amidase
MGYSFENSARLGASLKARAGFHPLRGLMFVLAVLIPAMFSSVPAMAGERANSQTVAYAFKAVGDHKRARIIVHFEQEPEIHWFMLMHPNRLVIDLPRTKFGFDQKSLTPRGMVREVRYGLVSDAASRLIIGMDGPFKVENLRFSEKEGIPGCKLMIDLVSVSDAEFAGLMADQAATTSSTVAAKADRLGISRQEHRRPFTIVVDPGHGGIDSGATGKDNSIEKNITLTFSKELKKELEKIENYKVFLTRDDDRYLRLGERSKFARDHRADLFISVHADTVSQKWVRGATVYTLSERASDALARATAERENLSDKLAGEVLPEEKQQVADILLDLVQRETKAFSNRFASELVSNLSGTIGMINNSHRSAGFQVLRSYDVPSVLVELGYLSNRHDADNLLDKEWRNKAITAIVHAVNSYSALKAADGGK